MILGQIVLDEKKMECLLKNDALDVRSNQEVRQGGPLPIKPIVVQFLSTIHTNQWQINTEWAKMTGTEGKNRLLEQIDDSNMKVDTNMQRIKNDNARILLERINDIISNEVVVGYKYIQLKYLIDNDVGIEYSNYIHLDEKIGTDQPALKSLEAVNKKANIRFKKVVELKKDNEQSRILKETEAFMNNPKVTNAIKDYLEKYTPNKIVRVANTNVIYKSFRRKAGMSKAQQVYLEEYVTKLRKAVRKTTQDIEEDIFAIFDLDAGYYIENKAKALEPIDDLFDSISIFDNAPNTVEENYPN